MSDNCAGVYVSGVLTKFWVHCFELLILQVIFWDSWQEDSVGGNWRNQGNLQRRALGSLIRIRSNKLLVWLLNNRDPVAYNPFDTNSFIERFLLSLWWVSTYFWSRWADVNVSLVDVPVGFQVFSEFFKACPEFLFDGHHPRNDSPKVLAELPRESYRVIFHLFVQVCQEVPVFLFGLLKIIGACEQFVHGNPSRPHIAFLTVILPFK